MQTLVSQLSPDQVDTILNAFGTIEGWIAQLTDIFGDVGSIVIEDVVI